MGGQGQSATPKKRRACRAFASRGLLPISDTSPPCCAASRPVGGWPRASSVTRAAEVPPRQTPTAMITSNLLTEGIPDDLLC